MPDRLATLLPAAPLDAFCRRWGIQELSVFGSALRADFRPDSDVDVLVTFLPHAAWSLWDLARMEEELGGLVGRRVDLQTRRAIETSRNWMRRDAILGSARTIYAR
ncbi:MAG: nucleotidyltransferase family protein [Alphaproteobacteria bacterium]